LLLEGELLIPLSRNSRGILSPMSAAFYALGGDIKQLSGHKPNQK
jgi:hypothetical protein